MNKALSLQKKFILMYRAAITAGLSREQFGQYVGMVPHSVARKRLKIKDKFGTDLAQLPLTGEYEIDEEQLELFESTCAELHEEISKNTEKEVRSTSKTYVITSAQNATPLHHGFFNCIKTYLEKNDAELLVIPYRYRNPNSLWTDKDHDWWHQDLVPYMSENNIELCRGLQVMGHIKMQPTAVNPLSGFDSYTGTDSGIFGHPKVQLKTIPTPSKSLPKILTSTGSLTIPNYTDSKAGHKGEFHHSLAAVIVEVTNNEFHIRHIHGDDETGEFYDLDKHYTADNVTENHRIEALVTGDTHIEFLDGDVDNATFTNPDSIMKVLKPKNLVYHDILDFYARNHHHRGNDIIAVGKHRYGRNNVEEGLQMVADFIDRNTTKGTTNIIVKSNHDEALDRWLREIDPKTDAENAQFYYYMKYHQLKNIKITDTGFTSMDPLEFWCHNPDSEKGLSSIENTVFLGRNQSFSVKNIEIGFHGDSGPNGARGSIQNMSKIGPKCIIGHSHSPGINEGAYQVGLSAKLNLEYVGGSPSSWLHTHCIVYPDGSRTLINIINGKWRNS